MELRPALPASAAAGRPDLRPGLPAGTASRSGRRRTRAPAPARPRAWRRSGCVPRRPGPAPIDAKNRPIGEAATLGLPNRSEIQPRRIGELMSPNRWMRKMNDRVRRRARRLAGTTLAVTVLHGPSTIDSKTDAPKRRPSDDVVLRVEDADDAQRDRGQHGERGEQQVGPLGELVAGGRPGTIPRAIPIRPAIDQSRRRSTCRPASPTGRERAGRRSSPSTA